MYVYISHMIHIYIIVFVLDWKMTEQLDDHLAELSEKIWAT